MRLADAGNKFTFRVYFDDISAEQLNELKWVITLGGNDSNNGYKIGHGKPLGLGSVKLKVERECVRRLDENGKYQIKENTPGFPDIVMDRQIRNEILKITDFDSVKGYDVSYPKIINKTEGFVKENNLAAHNWFSRNYSLSNRNAKPTYTLPEVISDDPELPAVEYKKQDSNRNSNNR